MIRLIEKHPVITIIATTLLMLLFSVHYLEVTIMEARNFITAREMITDGNWLLTTMNGEPRYQKPPLPTWLAAISALIFGIKTVFGYRLPGLLMVAVLGLASYFLSKKLLNNTLHALVNGLITITSFYVVAIVIEAPWDIFTHGFMLLGIYHVFQLFEKEKQYWQHTLLAGLFIGCSILCKGPVSFYALFLPFLISYAIVFKFKNFKAKVFSTFSFIIIALLIGGWWYAYVRYQDPETFLAITNRETGNWSSYNVRPFYYYWSFFTQSGLWTIPAFISLLYPYLKSRVRHLKVYRFSFYWTLIAVVLLSIIPEKKSRYLMPVLIPLAINTGFYIEYLFRRFKELKDKRETIPVYFNFGLIGLIALLFNVSYYYLRINAIVNLKLFAFASITLFTIGASLFFYLKQKEIKHVFYLTILFMVSAFIFAAPLSKSLKSSNYASITNLKEETEANNLKVYKFNYVSPEMIWQFGGKIQDIKVNDSTFNFPSENTFGLLANGISLEDQELLKGNYLIEKITTYDLNVAEPDSRSYKGRLVNHYYILTKK